MIVPEIEMPRTEDIRDPADAPQPNPRLHQTEGHNDPLKEGEFIICKDSPSSEDWYLAEVWKALPDTVEVKYLSTCTPPVEDYKSKSPLVRKARLLQAHFRRTWFFRAGASAGKGTTKPPYPSNEDLRVWSGPLPNREHKDVLLIRGVGLSGAGKLSKASAELASNLSIPHAVTPVVEDESSTPSPESYVTIPEGQLFGDIAVCCVPCTLTANEVRVDIQSATNNVDSKN